MANRWASASTCKIRLRTGTGSFFSGIAPIRVRARASMSGRFFIGADSNGVNDFLLAPLEPEGFLMGFDK